MNLQPVKFNLEQTTIWSFPDRGNWATHSGKYRGNWSPYIPRNLILRYSKEGDWLLDQFVGSGTTMVEAKLLNRNAIGVDVNEKAIKMSENSIQFGSDNDSKIYLKQGNATDLSFLKDTSIDLICTHPPYSDIIKYSQSVEGDLSLLSVEDFLEKMSKVAT